VSISDSRVRAWAAIASGSAVPPTALALFHASNLLAADASPDPGFHAADLLSVLFAIRLAPAGLPPFVEPHDRPAMKSTPGMTPRPSSLDFATTRHPVLLTDRLIEHTLAANRGCLVRPSDRASEQHSEIPSQTLIHKEPKRKRIVTYAQHRSLNNLVAANEVKIA